MKRKLLSHAISSCLMLGAFSSLHAQEDDTVELETYTAEEEVDDNLGILQSEPVDSVFGFGKTILETPRSVSSVTAEFLDEFNVTGINDIATFVPGSFTTSFFGVAGSLDIRGTPADNYFRGVKRLNNDGVFPTPIGATDRIDVIRGPMSPISGPSRVAGALNFIPKSARAQTGQYLEEATGQMSYTTGSWDKSILGAELGGPMKLGDNTLGFYIYAEIENSGSFYRKDFNDQTLLQGSFNMDLTASTRIEFGGMYQNWDGHENGGWNRVTQDLIDNGTYITGQPVYTPPDTNGDGRMSHDEIVAGFEGFGAGANASCAGGGTPQLFCFGENGPVRPSDLTADSIPANWAIDPTGTITLDPSQVLITDEDQYKTSATTLYFDVIHETGGGWTITNKLFYDAVESANSDAYGFSKMGDSWVVEDQLIFAKFFETKSMTADIQFSPSLRYTDAWYANDFVHEIFDRVDLSVGFNPASNQGSSTNLGPELEPWGINDYSKQTQAGLAFLSDLSFFESLDVLLGLRYDYVETEAETGDPATFFARTPSQKVDEEDDGASYTISVSYTTPVGIVPYVTYAEQSTVLTGVHDAIEVPIAETGDFLGKSEMAEAGIKANLFNDRLYLAAAVYEQERVAINSNVAESNEALKSDGYELEARWVPIDKLSIVATFASFDVVRTDLASAPDGNGDVLFTYLGAMALPQLDPTTIWGGIVGGDFIVDDEPPRGGIPETVLSMSASYRFTDTIAGSLSWTKVDEVQPSPVGGLTLPAYDLLNASLAYNADKYTVRFNVNNLLDETYFRANFPGLYGDLTVLPEKPRSWSAEFVYKF